MKQKGYQYKNNVLSESNKTSKGKTIILSEKQVEKVRQGLIAYESNKPDCEIGFEKPVDMYYTHVVNESPDCIEKINMDYNYEGAHPFVIFKGYENDPIIGAVGGETHSDMMGMLYDDVFENDGEYFDISNGLKDAILSKEVKPLLINSYYLQGRYFEESNVIKHGGNIISFYDYTIPLIKKSYSIIINLLNVIQKQGIPININTIDFDHWVGNKTMRFPLKWIGNGIIDSVLTYADSIEKKYNEEKPVYIIHAHNGNTITVDTDFMIVNHATPAINESTNEDLRNTIKSLSDFMRKDGLEIYPYPKIELNNDEQDGLFITTGYYVPDDKKIVLFCKNRHPKDILRTYAHEIIHHMQNLKGKNLKFSSKENIINNKEYEDIEAEAYLKGSIYFRKWTESEHKDYINESITPQDVDLSSFKLKDRLNPKFWKNNKLDSRIRLKLLDIADDFCDFLNINWVNIKDITITGSLANYTWNEKYSDIDLHILLDYKDVDERVDFVKEYFNSKKNEWNNKHQELKIFGFPIEVYVQDINEPHKSSGVYSLEKNEWVEEPNKNNFNADDFDEDIVKTKVSDYMNQIDKLEDDFNENDDEHQIEILFDDAEDLFDDIKDERKNAFKKSDKELSDGNVIFKTLRRNGYIEKLSNLKNKTYDKINSISEAVGNNSKLYHIVGDDSFERIKSIIENGLIPHYNKHDDTLGIYFSPKKFYDTKNTCLSILDTEENRKKYAFSPWLGGDVELATKQIPFDDLNVETIKFGYIDNEEKPLYSSTFFQTFIKNIMDKKGIETIAEYIATNNSYSNVFIYIDLFEMFVEQGTSHIFDNFSHIKTGKLLS